MRALVAVILCVLCAPSTLAKTWIVCPADMKSADCEFSGDTAIPAAVERAAANDTISIRAGRYAPVSHRDVRHQDVAIRGYVLIDGKDLTIVGEPGAILDGSSQSPASAIVVHRASVTIRNLEISGFRYAVEEDDLYDGHGIYVIDGVAHIDNVVIRNFQKMALTGRGDSQLYVSRLQVLDGHVGIWLKESAYLRLHDSIIRGNDSSAVTSYDTSAAHVSNCVIDSNKRYGLFGKQQGTIFVSDSLVLRNGLSATNATGDSRIVVDHSAVFGNAKAVQSEGSGSVQLGAGVVQVDPRLDGDYRPLANSPLLGKEDPDLRDKAGRALLIGPVILKPRVR